MCIGSSDLALRLINFDITDSPFSPKADISFPED